MDQRNRARATGMCLRELAATARLRHSQAATPQVPGGVTVVVVAAGPAARTDRLAVTAISSTRVGCARPAVRLHTRPREAGDGAPDVVDWAELAAELDYLQALGLPGECPVQVTVGCVHSNRCESVRLLGVAERPDPVLICLRQPRNAERAWPACRHHGRAARPTPHPSLPAVPGTDTLFAGLLELAGPADTVVVDPAASSAGQAWQAGPRSADVVHRILARLSLDWSHLQDEAGYRAALGRLNRVTGEVASLAGVADRPSALELPHARYVDLSAVARAAVRVERLSARVRDADDLAHWRAVWTELTVLTACFKDGPRIRLPLL